MLWNCFDGCAIGANRAIVTGFSYELLSGDMLGGQTDFSVSVIRQQNQQ